MSIQNHYLETAANLIKSNNGIVPLHIYLKNFFSQHKKYGSRDRRQISNLCYNYYRLGKALPDLDIQEKIVLALFLLSGKPNSLLSELNKTFDDCAENTVEEKVAFAGVSLSPNLIFPFKAQLSNGIDVERYAAQMLVQPDIFVRTRPGKWGSVASKLKELEWDHKWEAENTVRLKPAAQIDKYFKINEELVIQDLNSQQVGFTISEIFDRHNFTPQHLWDCCAASGGKSIMIKDLFPFVKLTVSDIRLTILQNLARRFKEAGIYTYHKFVADLAENKPVIQIKPTHFIIADVPCTGSGTWARTPEQLFFFKEEMIADYAAKQIAIAKNAINYLLPGGWFIYITCSVFKKENEGVVEKLLADDSFKLVHQELLNGTNKKADSMFVAIIQKHNI